MYENKKILILGAAKSGIAVAKLLAGKNNEIVLTDLNEIKIDVKNELENLGIKIIITDNQLDLLDNSWDLVIKNPAIMSTSPLIKKCEDLNLRVENEMEVAYHFLPKDIKIIGVTGSNGKTTTTRLISHTLSKMGYCVGMTNSSGIFVNNECIDIGDDTGFNSAKSILLNPDVDVAVLETARGGIIRKGLAYEEADVAVITNIREDHLGIDNINSMKDLCYVKALVGEAVKENGYVVINADDKWSISILDRLKSRKVFFTLNSNNKILKNNNIDDIYVYLEDENIIVLNKII